MHDYASNIDQLRSDRDVETACMECHAVARYATEMHTHHPAQSSGSRCTNCHMPYSTYGLLKGIRSHLIDSPTVQSSLDTGRPNACNLCHLDRSLGWTSDHLAQWHGQPRAELSSDDNEIAAAIRWLVSGDAGQRALIADAMGRPEAVRASGSDWLAPYLAHSLEDPYSAVRFIAGRSLRRLPGFADLEYDFLARPSSRNRARTRALATWHLGAGTALGEGRSQLLLTEGDLTKSDTFSRLVSQRDDRPVDLRE
jgi:hypothetical protein